jgi:hypothetical protein
LVVWGVVVFVWWVFVLGGVWLVVFVVRAQQLQPARFVAMAAYGDGGPWYIPVKEEYPKGGYEVSVANCSEGVDDVLTRGLHELFQA